MFGLSLELLLPVLVAVLIFLLCRSIVLWYWKIDQGIALLDRQRQLLEVQNDLLIKLLATQKVALQESSSSSAAQQR